MSDPLDDQQRAKVESVLQTHHRFIENVARQYAPAPDHVPDIVQNVGLQVCRGLKGFREEANIRTWLYRVTMNAARNVHRTERRHLQQPRETIAAVAGDEAMPPDQDDHVRASRRRDALHSAVERMQNPLQRDAMRNHLNGGGVLSGSKTTRHRARRVLRDLLADDPRLTD